MSDPSAGEGQAGAQPGGVEAALSEAQLGTIAAQVAVALKASTPQGSAPPVTGRTPSDAVTEIFDKVFDLLGKAAVALLAIGLLAVGYYFFEEQRSEKDRIYREQVEALEQQRNDALALTKEFYKGITDVSQQQIANLDSSLKLLTDISTEVDESQKEGFQQRLDAISTEGELEEARAEIDHSRAELQRKEDDLARLEEQAEADRRQNDAKLKEEKKKLERQSTELTQRAGTIGELLDALRDLSKATEDDLKRLGDDLLAVASELGSEAVNLQLELGQHFPDGVPDEIQPPLDRLGTLKSQLQEMSDLDQSVAWNLTQGRVRDFVVDPVKILKPYAGTEFLLSHLELDRLVGLSEEKILHAISFAEGIGFDFWVRASERSSVASDEALIGVVQKEGLLRVVVLMIDELAQSPAPGTDSTVERRVAVTFNRFGLNPAFVRNDRDWSDETLLTAFVEDGDIELNRNSRAHPDFADRISLSRLADDSSITPVFGDLRPINLLTEQQLDAIVADQAVPPSVRNRLRDPNQPPRLNFEMAQRAEDPARVLAAADLEIIKDADLRRLTERLLRDAIAGNAETLTVEAVEVAPISTEQFGELGALTLLPGFRVADAFISAARPEKQTGSTSGETAEITLVAEGESLPDGRLEFQREGPDSRWRLAEFERKVSY